MGLGRLTLIERRVQGSKGHALLRRLICSEDPRDSAVLSEVSQKPGILRALNLLRRGPWLRNLLCHTPPWELLQIHFGEVHQGSGRLRAFGTPRILRQRGAELPARESALAVRSASSRPALQRRDSVWQARLSRHAFAEVPRSVARAGANCSRSASNLTTSLDRERAFRPACGKRWSGGQDWTGRGCRFKADVEDPVRGEARQ